MSKKAYENFKKLCRQVAEDPEYLALEEERRKREAAFRAVMEGLTEEQCSVIMDYLGICAELDERSMEIACFAEEG